MDIISAFPGKDVIVFLNTWEYYPKIIPVTVQHPVMSSTVVLSINTVIRIQYPPGWWRRRRPFSLRCWVICVTCLYRLACYPSRRNTPPCYHSWRSRHWTLMRWVLIDLFPTSLLHRSWSRRSSHRGSCGTSLTTSCCLRDSRPIVLSIQRKRQ